MTRRRRRWVVRGGGNDLGRSGSVAALDRSLRSAASVVYRLEKRLRAAPECRGADARRAGGDAVWAHVREVGDRHHRRQFAASERGGGAGARDAPGSAGGEIASRGDPV